MRETLAAREADLVQTVKDIQAETDLLARNRATLAKTEAELANENETFKGLTVAHNDV